VGGYALRAREDSVRPQRLIGASGRPLDFTIRRQPGGCVASSSAGGSLGE
jgi:hypothetical protein